MAQITNKSEMYRLLRAGVLGNTLRLWPNWQDIYTSGYTGEVAIRSLIPDREFLPHIPIDRLEQEIQQYLERNNCRPKDIVIAEMQPADNRRLISIEVGYIHDVLVARYSRLNVLFREAMRVTHHVTHVRAKMLLKLSLDLCDYETLSALLDTYPTAIFELTQHERPLGVESKRMIIWEGRNY